MKHRFELPAASGKRRWRDRPWFPYLLTAGIVTVLFLVMMFFCKLYPFGDRSLASSDGKGQYLNFYSYFRNTFFSNNNVDYSFSTVLGGNIQGLYAYYLGSPLYLLFVLFPERQLLLALHVIIYLKFLAAALSFCAWTGYRKKGNLWMRAALSVSYAFMGYSVTFYSLLSWLDAMALLPLVALGLERLVRERKPLVYILSLAITVAANYYVGFMVCLASVLIYAALLFVSPEGTRTAVKRTILPFGVASLLAGALSAWRVLPAILALPNGRLQESQHSLEAMRGKFPFLHFFSKLFTGTTSADQFYNGLPAVFVGIIPLVLVALFFLNPGIRRRWKAAAAGALLVLFFSFHNSFLNTVWHGFTQNRMFNYRYSFVFSFLLLAAAWHSVRHWETLSAGAFTRCLAVLLGGTMLVFTYGYPYGSGTTLYFDLALMALGIALIFWKTQGRRGMAGALLCLMAVNCLANAVLSVDNIYNQFGSALQSERNNYLAMSQEGLALTHENESFCRIEKTYYQTYSDNMALDIPGASNYSSVERKRTLNFLWNLGLKRFVAWGHYTGDNPVASESLLGIRYLMTRDPLGPGRESYSLTGVTSHDVSVYRNPYALPLVMPSATLLPTPEAEDGCQFQNACWRSLAPEIDRDIFIQAPRMAAQMEEDDTARLLTYKIPEAGCVYLHLPGAYTVQAWPFTVVLHTEDAEEPQAVTLNNYQSIYPLGTFEAGEALTLAVTPNPEQKIHPEQFLIYVENQDALEAYSQAVLRTPMEIRKVTSSHLTLHCQVGADTPYLASTIPYDKGWTVTVDGRDTETLKNWDCMLAFSVEPGEHTVELRYHPPGKTAGLLITLVSAAAVAGGTALKAARKRKQGQITPEV